ncbi:hypothetical protein BG011_003611 [Mortierella polycephala]|uniref:Alkaline phosphatase n=1 Tax=Mortierella polycephala TaxID=41804 RepID=A0A9P6Q0Q7_9FUNG|nr:hypothetical protein BG011_003611 [Mortierella polycephala]
MVRREASAPLLANEDPRDSFDEDERALLQQEENKQIRRERRRMVLCLGLAIILTTSAAAFTFFFAKKSLGKRTRAHDSPGCMTRRSRNVIMMVTDGFGPASQTYGRSFYQFTHNKSEEYMSPLDEILVGTSRTRSSDSLVTDSAAGATAFSCALKTYNAAVGVDTNGTPCGTILEAAKDLGMLTGLVVTSRVTHATPAAFSAHVIHRDMESEIAAQQTGYYPLNRQVDLLLGGGRCFFMPNTTAGSCRSDDKNLIELAQTEKGWKTIMLDRKAFDAQKPEDIELPVMGLFNLDHMNYEIDRDPAQEPSLKEMAAAALKSLKANTGPNQGFFLMIEGSRIDMGAHNNDPVAHVHDIMQYYETVAVVRKFVANNPDTLVISTSDHETGGFTLGLQPDPNSYPDYLWKPEVIKRAKASTEILTQKLVAYQAGEGKGSNHKHRREFVKTEILKHGMGITDATEDEIEFLANPSTPPSQILPFLGHAISFRAYLGWTTMGHTGVDVNLYATGEQSEKLRGNHENTDIGKLMTEYLNVNLDYITRKLEIGEWFKFDRSLFGSMNHRSEHERSGR